MVSGGGKLQNADRQMSEAFITSVFLAMSGGFQDAYTYFTRDEVFSNAQTGNVVLMSHNFMTGQWGDGLRYLFPVLAFAIGVVAAERIQNTFKYAKKLHWRQMILLIEILILFVVGFMPGELDMLATVLVSFSCAMQVQTFRKVGGYSYASTMCIGNLRSGTAALSVYCREKRPEQLKQALYYFGIIFFFAIGAGGGGNLSMRLGIPAIWVSDVLLLISFILIESFETKLNEFTESQKMVNSTLDEVRRLLSEIKTAKNNRDIHLVAGQPWGYGGSAGVQELKDKLTSLEDLLDGQGARQEALLDEIERSIREMTKVAQKGRFGLFK